MNTITAPVYIKREGAIKGKYAYNLGSDEIFESYNKLKDLKDEIDVQKEKIADILSIKIKEQKSDDDRKILINLKRNIYNLRKSFIRIIEDNQNLMINAGVCEDLENFMDLYRTIIDWQEQYEKKYKKEELKERIHLVNAYKENEEVLGKAMKFIHPTTMQKLKNYLQIDVKEHKAKERKFDDTVAKVITRAAHKTSPFSTLTHVGAGIIGEELSCIEDSNKKYVTISMFNIAYALRVFEKVMLVPEIIQNSTYRFADTLVLLREKFYWTILKDDPQKRKKVYKSMDELITVKATNSLMKIYKEFKDKKEFSFVEVRDFLTGNIDITLEKANQLLIILVQKQFFCNTKFLDQNSDNIIGDFIAILAEYQSLAHVDQIEQLLINLKQVEYEVSVMDQENANDQLKSLQKISSIFSLITKQYGIDEFDEKQLIYMDSLLTKVEPIDTTEWNYVMETLSSFQEFSKIFDVSYRFQLILGKIFYEKFGLEKVKVKEKEHIILDTLLTSLIKYTSLWDNQLRISNDEFGIDIIGELDKLNNEFLANLFQQSDQEVVHISKEEMQSYTDQIPNLAKKIPQSNSFFIQNTENRNVKVLNDFYAGHLIFFSRFLRNMPSICEHEKFKQYVKDTIWDDNLADMYLMYGFNANRRKNITQKAVNLPNNRYINNKKKQFQEVYDWGDLYLEYSTESRQIKIYSEKEELKVQFLGTLITTLLPAVPAMIHLLNFNVVLLKDIGYSLIFDFMEKKAEFEVKAFPRLVINQNVVVARRRWLINTKYIQDILCAKDSEVVNKCLDFIRTYSLPRRTFISKFFYKNEGLNTGDDNTDKPMYMDMSSPVLTVLFKKSIENTKYILMEEVLPDLRKNECESYVSEYIFEITQVNERN